MQILHIDPDDIDNPLSGGGPIRTLEVCQRMSDRHDITVLTPTFPGSTPEKWRGRLRYLRLGRRIGDHGSSHHITFWLSLPLAVRRFKYDLLVEDLMPPCGVTLAPLMQKKKPVIASVQWFYAEMWRELFHFPFDVLQNYGVRHYNNFIVLTESMRQRIEKLNPRARIEVIANAVDDDLLSVEPEYGDFIFYLGLVDFEIKGVDLLLKAYARVPVAERLPLVMAGHGYNWPAFDSLVKELDLGAWVKCLGKVTRPERLELLRRCRFLCVPSRRETFGLTLLEGCAVAKPVAFFDMAPMNEVAAAECPRAPAFDIQAYADVIVQLLRMPTPGLAALGVNCREWAKQHTWQEIAARQERFYLEVAGQ